MLCFLDSITIKKPSLMSTFTFQTIAIARTPFNEKFGIPRQSGLVNIPGVIELQEPWNRMEAVDGLEQVSHIWLHFVFSEHLGAEPRLTVRPPRLGGNKKRGVFATRSSFRPNPIGQSLVKLDSIQQDERGVELHVSGIDLLDGTPIIDIKPYLPYADIQPEAFNIFASSEPDKQCLLVEWHAQALQQLVALTHNWRDMQCWVTELIQLDPRPAYKSGEIEAEYGMALFNLNFRWRVVAPRCVKIIQVEAR